MTPEDRGRADGALERRLLALFGRLPRRPLPARIATWDRVAASWRADEEASGALRALFGRLPRRRPPAWLWESLRSRLRSVRAASPRPASATYLAAAAVVAVLAVGLFEVRGTHPPRGSRIAGVTFSFRVVRYGARAGEVPAGRIPAHVPRLPSAAAVRAGEGGR